MKVAGALVERASAAHAAADVEAVGPDLLDRLGARSRVRPPARNSGTGDLLADAPAQRPVVAAAGAAQLLDGQVGVARIQQQRVHLRRRVRGLAQRDLAPHVDHLHQPDAGQGRAQGRGGVSGPASRRAAACPRAAAAAARPGPPPPARQVSRKALTPGGTAAATSAMVASSMTPGPLGMARPGPGRRRRGGWPAPPLAALAMQQTLTRGTFVASMAA